MPWCRANGKAVAGEPEDITVVREERDIAEQPVQDALDYEAYYPTVLPLKHPGSRHEEEEDVENVSWELGMVRAVTW